MVESRRFSAADDAEIEHLGAVRDAAADRVDAETGRVAVNKFRADRAGGHSDGFRGEWAVADSLHVERPKNVTGRADNGADLVAPNGWSVNVRYTPYHTGRLMCPENRPIKADSVVLVVGTNNRLVVAIVGALLTWRFYELAVLGDFDYGPTLWVAQERLVPWERARARLMGETDERA